MMIFKSFDKLSYIEKAVDIFTQSNKTLSVESLSSKIGLNIREISELFKSWGHVSVIDFMNSLSPGYGKNKLKENTSKNLLVKTQPSSEKFKNHLNTSFKITSVNDYDMNSSKSDVSYGFHESIFGECLVAITNNVLCHLSFLNNSSRRTALESFISGWRPSRVREDVSQTQEFIDKYFQEATLRSSKNKKIPILLKGSTFQVKIWETLLLLPFGELLTYSDIASVINKKTAVRAVATAVARNKIAYVIPCHRIIPQSGDFGNYRWGERLKKLLIAFESARLKCH